MSASPRQSFVDEECSAETALMEPTGQQRPPLRRSNQLMDLEEAGLQQRAPHRRTTRMIVLTTLGVLALAACGVAGVARGTSKPSSFTVAELAALINAAETPAATTVVDFPIMYRDFDGNVPDQGITMFEDLCLASDKIVKPTLGADNKPVWDETNVGAGGIKSKFEFDSLWNTRTPDINKEIPAVLTFNKTASGYLRHDSPEFWPLNVNGQRNLYFSMEMHTTFTYQGGEEFTFRGDDDVFLYIDGILVVNLGGCHEPMTAKVELDTDSRLSLKKGEHYPFDFFFAERRCCGSSLRMETSLKLEDPATQAALYKCCLTHVFTKSWSWFCTNHKKYGWCDEEPQTVTATTSLTA